MGKVTLRFCLIVITSILVAVPLRAISQDWEAINQQLTAAYQKGDYANAVVLGEKALIVAREEFGAKHPNTLSSMNNLALLYKSQGRYEKAEPLYVDTLALKKEVLGEKHPGTLTSMNNLAGLYESQGRNEKAEPLYVDTLALRKEVLGEKHPNTLQSMNNLAMLYQSQGHYEKAELLLVETLALMKEVLDEKHPSTLQSMNNLAMLYQSQGRYEKAELLLVETLTLRKEVLDEKHPDTLQSMNNLAALYGSQGRYEKAEPLYVDTLALWKEVLGEKHPHTLLSMNNLAALYESQGRYEKAEPLLVETLTLRKEVLGEKHRSTLTSMNNLALLYKSQGRYEKAEPLYVDTLALWKEVLGEKHPNTLLSMNNLALLYRFQGRYEKAEPLLVETLALRKKVLGEKHPHTLASMNNLAALYGSQGRYEKAEPLYVDTLALWKEVLGEKHPDTLTSMHNLAFLYQRTGQWREAEQLWAASLRASNQFLDQVLWGAGEKTRQSYIGQQQLFSNNLLTFYSTRNTPELAKEALYFSISRKGQLLRIASEVSALAKSRQTQEPEIIGLIDEFKATRSQLAALTFSDKADIAQRKALEEKLSTLERRLGRKVSAFRQKRADITPEQILSVLKPGQAVVDFLVFNEVDLVANEYKGDQLIALIANREQGVELIELGASDPVADWIQAYRAVLERVPSNGVDPKRQRILTETGQTLYQRLWRPLEDRLRGKKEIFLIPDGVLHLLPFKTLQDSTGEYLINKVRLIRLTSARDLVLPPLPADLTGPAIFADPLYGGMEKAATSRTAARALDNLRFGRLLGTREEGEAIERLMQQGRHGAALFTELQASEPAMTALTSPRILHLATHGFFLERIVQPSTTGLLGAECLRREQIFPRGVALAVSPQPYDKAPSVTALSLDNPLTRSGLALSYANLGVKGEKQADGSDGLLTALEVLDLDLSGTKLVALSACETGLGDVRVGEGVYSLSRAFQEAGAEAVLSTLWKVSDRGTNVFMQSFYRRFLNGQSAQDALQETQTEFMGAEPWNDPAYWAPFVMVGT